MSVTVEASSAAYPSSETLLTDVSGGVLLVTFNRPEVRNAINRQVQLDLRAVLETARADDAVGAVVLTGAGEKAFIAGADISQVAGYTKLTALDSDLQRLFDLVEEFPKPTIAAVNGFALGGGCEIAMACDIRIASQTTRFGLPETALSVLPGAGGTQRLARLIGTGRAIELILTGRMVDADEAERIGLVTTVTQSDELHRQGPRDRRDDPRPRARSPPGSPSWSFAPAWTRTSAPARSSSASPRPCSTRARTSSRARPPSSASAHRSSPVADHRGPSPDPIPRRPPMDLSLNEDQLSFKALAREFLDKEVVPHRAEWDRRESVDTAIIPKLGEIGFFGLTIPEEYGGLGGDYITYCIGMEELGRADSSVRGIVSVSMGLVGKVILSHGTEEQKHQYLPGIANGTQLGCFGLTEPDNGSDPATLKTRARRDGSDYVLNGQKIFITNGTWADVVPRLRPDRRRRAEGGLGVPGADGHSGLRGARDPRQARPARPGDGRDFLTDVRVPESARLGDEGEGFSIAMHSLDKGRVSVGSGVHGHHPGLPRGGREVHDERKQFGRPIASFQLVQDIIAQISVDVDAARLLTWRAADLIERGEPFGVEASKAKYFASEAAVRAANGAAAGLRRLRLRRRVPGAEVPAGRPRHDALRGHEPDPEAAHRARRDGDQRLHLSRTPRAASRKVLTRSCHSPGWAPSPPTCPAFGATQICTESGDAVWM